jgi:hypothetical protein
MWHARIRKPEQALELVKALHGSSRCMPDDSLSALGRSQLVGWGDTWLALDRATYDTVCPAAAAREIEAGPVKRFAVTRCLIGVTDEDGSLYSVEERVMDDGERRHRDGTQDGGAAEREGSDRELQSRDWHSAALGHSRTVVFASHRTGALTGPPGRRCHRRAPLDEAVRAVSRAPQAGELVT